MIKFQLTKFHHPDIKTECIIFSIIRSTNQFNAIIMNDVANYNQDISDIH